MEHDRAAGPGEFDLEDPNLEEKLVNELKSQGIFDQFRKDCLSDVDTKVWLLLSVKSYLYFVQKVILSCDQWQGWISAMLVKMMTKY